MNYLKFPKQLLLLISAALLFLACDPAEKASSNNTQTTTASQADTTDRQFKAAPDFTLKTMEGNPFTLSDHKGKVIVLNFWATWCAPCREEIPDFIELQKELKDKGVLFVGISLDEEGWSKVRPYANKMDINYPIMVANKKIHQQYGPIRAIPTTLIVNKNGGVEYVAPGMLTKEKLKPVLKKLASR